jgi:hypothetical protein
MPFPGVVEGNDDAEEYDQGNTEKDICNALCVHCTYFFFLLIIRYSTTMAQVGITVNATVARIDMSISSPYEHAPAAGIRLPAHNVYSFLY